MNVVRMDFGYHKNKLLQDVPLNYVEWMNRENVLNNKVQRYFFVQAHPNIFGDEPAVPNMTTARMTFGMHEDSRIIEVPVSYVRWMAANNVLDDKPELRIFFAALYPLLFPALAGAAAAVGAAIPVAAFVAAATHHIVVAPVAIEEIE